MGIASSNTRPHLLGSQWDELGFNQLGWRLLPLRAFLGVTFVYAALQKLANPEYLRAASPTSFMAQTHALESTSPIAPLLRLSLHAPTLVALLIAFGELAVALGIIVGLWSRAAALGGMLLSLTFFLTVSWSTTPYFYGSDIVFVFAWSVFAMCGTGGVLSLDAWIGARADAVRSRSAGPVDVVRRQLLVGAKSAALLAIFGGVLGATTAVIGRLAGGTRRTDPHRLASAGAGSGTGATGKSGTGKASDTATNPSPSTTPSPHHTHHQSAAPPPGVAIGPVSAVPVGQGRLFTDPASGQPAWLLRPDAGTVAAFSAVCTHAGCTVEFDPAGHAFVCPCHGGRYDAGTGAVVAGPPPTPLAQIPARIVNNEIRVD